ncbi:hypothetical protein RDI58_026610 [Solanum bulbocastanum]|uniref:Disease resistance protein Roq1-like winged-helix domain-containing protein n=1 Tax=Solanum bulbocastanum TaxID=147425 RepID=A0AAN8SX87_SOLBU
MSNFFVFEGSSCVLNIREVSKQPNGLVKLQKQRLSDIQRVSCVDEGIVKISDAVSGKRVLLVLDDVDDSDQVNAVLGMKIDKVYRVETLDRDESLELFSWHTFGKPHPVEGFLECSNEVMKRCGGIPLALRVLGSSLAGKNAKKDKDFAVKILDKCEIFTVVGIQNLIDRDLLSVPNGHLVVHQLIQDMGREIVRQESFEEPGRPSRLWCHGESFYVLKNRIGTETIEGIILDGNMLKDHEKIRITSSENYDTKHKLEEFLHYSQRGQPERSWMSIFSSHTMDNMGVPNEDLVTDAFIKMRKLKFLLLSNVQLSGCYKQFPKKLRWLPWHSLRHFYQLRRTPDFSELPKLEQLILERCINLTEVDESIGYLEGFTLLNLNGCTKLRRIPESICMLKLLETLDIAGCCNLEYAAMDLPDKIADGIGMNQVVTSKHVLPWHPVQWSWLRKEKVCQRISPISFPASLVTLGLSDCNLGDNAFLHVDLTKLNVLKDLNLSGNPISYPPESIIHLCRLEKLTLTSCTRQKSISQLPNGVDTVDANDCISLEKVCGLPSSCGVLYINCANLIEMDPYFKLEPLDHVNEEILRYQQDPLFIGVPEGDQERMMCLSYWDIGNSLQPGDVIEVSASVGEAKMCFSIKEVGMRIISGRTTRIN